MRLPRTATLALCGAGELVTFAASDAPLTADTDRRIVEGLIVPFGPAGHTAAGLLTFRSGALSWASDVRRVKLLVEHDQNRPVGTATELRETPAGVWGRFTVAAGPLGDAVLAEVADGRRDGFSIGVQLDGASEDRLRRARSGQAVAGSGQIRETSVVSIPAFDDARGTLVAAGAGGLVTMTTPGQPAPVQPAQPVEPAPPAPVQPPPVQPPPVQPPPVQPDSASTPGSGVTPAAAAPLTTGAAGGPAPVRAAAGSATYLVTAEAATYTLDGRGPSLVVDAANARFNGDRDAADRMARFNRELTGRNPNALAALVAATGALTTFAPGDPIASPALTTDADIPATFLPQRTDVMRAAVDAGRPLVSRLPRVTLTSAQPFMVPQEGEFTGVDYHTEGQAHVPAGTLTLSDSPVVPRAVSGYYELSRELVDASNPAIDRIALRAMLRGYRRKSEEHAVAAIAAIAPTIGGIDTAMELRAALVGFVDDDGFGADFVAASQGLLAGLYADVDTAGRPMIATGGNAPTATTGRAGYTGAGIDGIEIVRVPRLAANVGYAIRAEGILFGESAVQQFRFEEIAGPGRIALALWAYVAAAVLDPDDVLAFSAAALA